MFFFGIFEVLNIFVSIKTFKPFGDSTIPKSANQHRQTTAKRSVKEFIPRVAYIRLLLAITFSSIFDGTKVN